jgi:hypothetical protein
VGKREEAVSDLVKEITAIDSINIGPTEAAKINGVPVSSASKYGNGQDIATEEVRTRVLQTRYEIQDTAIAKLMQTLEILNPNDFEKPRDKIALVTGLSQVVDKISDKRGDGDKPQVHLHLYGPNQKKESEYETIDV